MKISRDAVTHVPKAYAFYAIRLLGFAKPKNMKHPLPWKHWFGFKLEVAIGVEALLDWEAVHGVERLQAA